MQANTINPEVKEKWVQALRSGEYDQTTKVLRDNEGFCCLGVLTDLYLQEHDEDWKLMKNGYYAIQLDVRVEYEALAERVQEWAGLASPNGTIDGGECLAEMNDSGHYSFEDIANVIEEKM